jgi:hypothetical protein
MRANRNPKASRSEVEQTVAVGFDPVQLPDSSQRLVQLVEIGLSEVVADVDLGWRDGRKWRRKHRPRRRNIAKLATLQVTGLHLSGTTFEFCFVDGQTHRSTSGSALSNNTGIVEEKASGPAVDDNVVAQCSKGPQISTNLNRASGRPLAGKRLKTDLLRYFRRRVWGSIPHCCKADSTLLGLDLLPGTDSF